MNLQELIEHTAQALLVGAAVAACYYVGIRIADFRLSKPKDWWFSLLLAGVLAPFGAAFYAALVYGFFKFAFDATGLEVFGTIEKNLLKDASGIVPAGLIAYLIGVGHRIFVRKNRN